MRDNIEILLHCIAVIKGFYDPDIHTLSDLSKLYKSQISKLSSESDLTSFLKDINQYAQVYKEKILTFDGSTAFSFNDRTLRLFHILEILQILTFHPFIIFILKTNAHEADRFLSDLERFIIRRMISGQETKSYNKLCKEFIQDPDSIANRTNEATDEQIDNGLKAISNKNASLILFWVELYRRSSDKRYDFKELKYDYSLEHVMPHKWEEYWKDMPEKKGLDGKVLTFEDAKKDRYNKINWIGNMTLLTSSLNSSLRNSVLEKKINGDGRRKGMKAYASLSITQDDIVSWFERGGVRWDEQRITERTALLSREIEHIWRVYSSPLTSPSIAPEV